MMHKSAKHALDEEEDSNPPAKISRRDKKKMVSHKKNSESSSPSHQNNHNIALPLDALSMVMEFLSPRELFNVAFTCKTLKKLVTTKMVVRSASIGGWHMRHKLMSVHAKHRPSPLRLLRLANGKKCEFCSKADVNIILHTFRGVYACLCCSEAMCF